MSLGWLRSGLLAICLALLAGCGGGGGDPVDPNTLPSIERSSMTKSGPSPFSYPIYVHLPPGYQTSTTSYPVVYAMDAEWAFDSFSDALFRAGKQVILVGIGNGDAQALGRRKLDYSMPGAEAHYRFLIDQVLPAVEAKYRIDPTRRTLVGHSMGGLFAALVMILEDPAQRRFANYVSQDGSFWFQEDVVAGLEQALSTRTASLPVNLFLFSATQGGEANVRWVEPFRDLLVQRNYSGLVLRYEAFNMGHVEMNLPSFRRAIDVLYPTN